MNIYIFGRGEGRKFVERCLAKETKIIAYIDNYSEKKAENDGIPIIRTDDIQNGYDYIVVSLMKYADIKETLINMGVSENCIICFFRFEDAEVELFHQVFDMEKWRMELLWKHYREEVIPLSCNLPYELYAESENVKKSLPKVASFEDTVRDIIKNKKSLARFGDGEFEMLQGRHRPVFQEPDEKLRNRLYEVIRCQDDRLLIAVADNYGKLDKYTDEAAKGIRQYMTPEVRKEHMELLGSDRVYGDAYLSRPYMIYRKKTNVKEKFGLLKLIWEGESLLIVEGKSTRFGMGNDLLNNAKAVKRILVPDHNAFSKYDEIFQEVLKYEDTTLVLAILGPAATVLAYDLTQKGRRAIDIGQLDTEYEWYLRGVKERCGIPGKMVSEVSDRENTLTDAGDTCMELYESEIVGVIR